MTHCDHTNDDLTCDRMVNEFLLDYFEGALPEPERAAFEAHLSECVSCVKYLDSYKKTVSATRGCGELGPVGKPPEALVAAIMDAARKAGLCGKHAG
ncbi:MAG: anti-sigma factor family protein [Phycisphaerales bacterium]